VAGQRRRQGDRQRADRLRLSRQAIYKWGFQALLPENVR
jgi:hypothetical protein